MLGDKESWNPGPDRPKPWIEDYPEGKVCLDCGEVNPPESHNCHADTVECTSCGWVGNRAHTREIETAMDTFDVYCPTCYMHYSNGDTWDGKAWVAPADCTCGSTEARRCAVSHNAADPCPVGGYCPHCHPAYYGPATLDPAESCNVPEGEGCTAPRRVFWPGEPGEGDAWFLCSACSLFYSGPLPSTEGIGGRYPATDGDVCGSCGDKAHTAFQTWGNPAHVFRCAPCLDLHIFKPIAPGVLCERTGTGIVAVGFTGWQNGNAKAYNPGVNLCEDCDAFADLLTDASDYICPVCKYRETTIRAYPPTCVEHGQMFEMWYRGDEEHFGPLGMNGDCAPECIDLHPAPPPPPVTSLMRSESRRVEFEYDEDYDDYRATCPHCNATIVEPEEVPAPDYSDDDAAFACGHCRNPLNPVTLG